MGAQTSRQRAEAAEAIRERDAVLAVLAAGHRLLRANGQTETASAVIWALFRDSVDTAARLGDKEQRWLKAGTRSHMLDVVRSWAERWDMVISRLQDPAFMRLAGRDGGYDRTKIAPLEPTDAEFDRLCIVIGWLQFFAFSRDPARMQRCFLALAGGAPWHKVARLWRPGNKVSRQAVNDIRVRGCRHIERGLQAEYGILWDRARGWCPGRSS